MPFRYDILQAPEYAHVQMTGGITLRGYFACMRSCTGEAAFYASIPILFEIGREATLDIGELNEEHVSEAATLIGEARGDAQYRVAVAGGPLDVRAFCMMAQEIANDTPQRRAFESKRAALDWLCLCDGSRPPTSMGRRRPHRFEE